MYIIHAFCFASHKCHIEEASSARITTRQAPAYLLKPERKDLLNFAFQLNLPFSSTSLPLSPYYIQDDYPSLWCLGLPSTRYTAQTEKQESKSPHIYLYFANNPASSFLLEASINIKST
jgi:hypothetical protein